MTTILLGVGIIVAVAAYFLPRALYSKPDGKYRIAMAGRSVTDHLFKYWNWPGLLHRYVIYRSLPLPYTKYSRDGFYFEYIPMDPPSSKSDPSEFGVRMFDSLRQQVEGKKFDALFFKFCYVDYRDKSVQDEDLKKKHFGEMTALVQKVHAFATDNKMKLLLGNALPTLKPGPYGQELRLEFNQWLTQYEAANEDVVVVDLFGSLTNGDGSLRKDLARDPADSHINVSGYKLLERELISKARRIKGEK